MSVEIEIIDTECYPWNVKYLPEYAFLVGLSVFLAGVAMIHVPSALIAFGLLTMAAYFRSKL